MMPSGLAMSTISRVILMSAEDGVGSPEGWLWTRMRADGESSSARFMETSGDALPDYELLELLLFRSVPRRDVKPIAKQLLKRFGTFAEVLAAPPNRLMEVDGVGESMITDLKVVEAAARRIAKGAVAKRPVLSSWSAVLDYCRTAMAFAEKEQFRLLFLDKRNALIADEVQQSGTVDHTPVYPARSSSGRWSCPPPR